MRRGCSSLRFTVARRTKGIVVELYKIQQNTERQDGTSRTRTAPLRLTEESKTKFLRVDANYPGPLGRIDASIIADSYVSSMILYYSKQ